MQNDMISLGDVCRERLQMQCQYGARYADPAMCNDAPTSYCGRGLRITGDCGSYHDMRIHEDDVEQFVARVISYRVAIGAIAMPTDVHVVIAVLTEEISQLVDLLIPVKMEPGIINPLGDRINAGLTEVLSQKIGQKNALLAALVVK